MGEPRKVSWNGWGYLGWTLKDFNNQRRRDKHILDWSKTGDRKGVIRGL